MFLKRFIILFFLSFFSSAIYANEQNFAFFGDAGKWNGSSKSLRDALASHQMVKLINSGDNLYNNILGTLKYDDVWKNWRGYGFQAYAFAIGNHNISYNAEVSYFGLPAEYYSKVEPGLVRFIVLNSDNTATAFQQAFFLQNELENATEPFVFIVFHHPSYTLSLLHNSIEKMDFHRLIRPLLIQYRNKVTSLLLGHDHVGLIAHFNDLPVILNGTGQEQRSHVVMNYDDDGVAVRTNWFVNDAPYWVNIRLKDDDAHAQLDFVNAKDDTDRCTVLIATGQAAVFGDNCSH